MADIVMAYIVMARTCEGTQDARRLIQRVTGVGARGQQAHLHRPRVQQLDVLQEPRLQHVRRRVRRQLARRTSKKNRAWARPVRICSMSMAEKTWHRASSNVYKYLSSIYKCL